MNRTTLFIILGALGAVLLGALLWWWFLSSVPKPATTNGSFGAAQNRTIGGNGGAVTGNGAAGALPNTAGQQGTTGQTYTSSISIGSSTGTLAQTGTYQPYGAQAQVGVTGVNWISGSPYSSGGQSYSGNNYIPLVIGGPDSSNTGTGGGSNANSGADNGAGSGSTGTTNTSNTINVGGSGTVFDPTAINAIANSNPNGSANIDISSSGGGGGGMGLGGAVAGTLVAGALSCTTFLVSSIAGVMSTASLISVQTNVPTKNGEDVLDCLARAVAKAAIQAITSSIVDFIDHGFQGSPSFVQNPTSFFTNVADNAAGNFIQSSALSFLCSPFQLKIKLAIASSYAHQNQYQQCSLSKVVSNMQNFMNSDFSAGGWPGMLSFTTTPENNPYGAYIGASVGIELVTSNAVARQANDLAKNQDILSLKEETGCTNTENPPDATTDKTVAPVTLKGSNALGLGNTDGSGNTFVGSSNATRSVTQVDGPTQSGKPLYRVCDLKTTTPGSVIYGSINKTMGQSQDSLDLAKSFDEIISALIQQLVKGVMNGLSKMSGSGGYASNFYSTDQLNALSLGQSLVTSMNNDVNIAQQYGQTLQGDITDIQTVQAQLNDESNCWLAVATRNATSSSSTNSATTTDSATVTTALANAAAASSTLTSLSAQVDQYNAQITQVNASIGTLEGLQSQSLSAISTDETTAVSDALAAGKASGTIITQDGLQNAQQNRSTLQAQMASLSTQTSTNLKQCQSYP